MDKDARKKWANLTQIQLVDELKNSIGPPVLEVNVTFVSQDPEYESKSRRSLRRLQNSEEQKIVFNVDYAIQSALQITNTGRTNIDVFITGAFVSDFKRTMYMELLKTLGGPVFENVSNVAVISSTENDGDGTDTGNPGDSESDTPNDSDTGVGSPEEGGVGIGVLVGVAMVVLIVAVLGLACYVRCKRREPRKKKTKVPKVVTSSKLDSATGGKDAHANGSGTSESESSIGDASIFYKDGTEGGDDHNYVPWFNVALDPPSHKDIESDSDKASVKSASSWFKFSRGPASDRSANEASLAESATSGSNYASWFGGISLRSIRRSDVSNKSGSTIETKSSNSSTGEYTVTVPKGKLGMLLDDSDGGKDYPKVQTIKPGSPFEGKVQEGEYLISVDGQDLKGMKLKVISHILAFKKDNDSRAFTFVRQPKK